MNAVFLSLVLGLQSSVIFISFVPLINYAITTTAASLMLWFLLSCWLEPIIARKHTPEEEIRGDKPMSFFSRAFRPYIGRDIIFLVVWLLVTGIVCGLAYSKPFFDALFFTKYVCVKRETLLPLFLQNGHTYLVAWKSSQMMGITEQKIW